MAETGRKGTDSNTEDDNDEGFECVFCTMNEKEKNTNIGYLLGQVWRIVNGVTNNSFNKKRVHVVPEDGVGLDNMYSVDVFGNSRLLESIETVEKGVRTIYNTGTVLVKKKVYLNDDGRVWYHPQAINNILSLSKVQKIFRVTYDSRKGNYSMVHKPNGINCVFSRTEKGLYASQVLCKRNQTMLVSTAD